MLLRARLRQSAQRASGIRTECSNLRTTGPITKSRTKQIGMRTAKEGGRRTNVVFDIFVVCFTFPELASSRSRAAIETLEPYRVIDVLVYPFSAEINASGNGVARHGVKEESATAYGQDCFACRCGMAGRCYRPRCHPRPRSTTEIRCCGR